MMQTMTHEEAFLADIREHPSDDTPRLIFADWLEENGDPDRGQFIRLQVIAAQEGYPEKHPLREQARELLVRNWERWVTPLARLIGSEQYEPYLSEKPNPLGWRMFPRGFIEQLTLVTRIYITHAKELHRLIPLTHLQLRGGGGLATELASCESLLDLLTLSFIDYYSHPLSPSDMIVLAASPHLRNVRSLHVGHNNLGDAGVYAIANSSSLTQLGKLNLAENGLTSNAVALLADSKNLGHLRELSLSRNAIDDSGAEHLVRAPWFAGLKTLELSDTAMSTDRLLWLRQQMNCGSIFHRDYLTHPAVGPVM
jgi:uncharacterized protein (TIGR02996 family)